MEEKKKYFRASNIQVRSPFTAVTSNLDFTSLEKEGVLFIGKVVFTYSIVTCLCVQCGFMLDSNVLKFLTPPPQGWVVLKQLFAHYVCECGFSSLTNIKWQKEEGEGGQKEFAERKVE